jgi:TamB, inner membrane protein subunit of TAM complex
MDSMRRLARFTAFVGTFIVGVVAALLILSQTSFIRERIRRYAVAQAGKVLNGELSIRRLEGNLFYGVRLSGARLILAGREVFAADAIDVDYDIADFFSHGIVLRSVVLQRPTLRLERDSEGWNVARLVKRERTEAQRQGPGRPVSLRVLRLVNGTVVTTGERQGIQWPRAITALNLDATFAYEPVHFSTTISQLRFQGIDPAFSMHTFAGAFAVKENVLYIDDVRAKTAESAWSISGVVRDYRRTREYQLTFRADRLSLPEISRIWPRLSAFDLHPTCTIKANGPAERLALDIDFHAELGAVRGLVTADLAGPDFGVRGELDLAGFDVSRLMKPGTTRSDITGHTAMDLTFDRRPVPALERMHGPFRFAGPHVAAFGYEGSDVRVVGRLDGIKVTLDSTTTAAYGGTATARGFIDLPVRGRSVALDLSGSADRVDLRQLPRSLSLPRLATDLSISTYNVRVAGDTVAAEATLHSSTVEGATLAEGTSGELLVRGRPCPCEVSYSARGYIDNGDLERIGRALELRVLGVPKYQSDLHGDFDLRVSGTALESMTLDARGTLKNSRIFSATIPTATFTASIDRAALTVRSDGYFQSLNPALLFEDEIWKADLTGSLDGTFGITDLTRDITPDSLLWDGRVTLTGSTVRGIAIETADIRGSYRERAGEVQQLTLDAPSIRGRVSGAYSFAETGESNLRYNLEIRDLAALSDLTGRADAGGSATLDGLLTGNRTVLQTSGTLNGSDARYANASALDLNSRYKVVILEASLAKAILEAESTATFVKVPSFEMNELTATTKYEQGALEFKTSFRERGREVEAKGDIVFHPAHQEIHLPEFTVTTAGVQWRTPPDVSAALRYGGGRLEIDRTQLVSGNQSIELEGALALEPEAPAGILKIGLRGVEIAQLEALTLQNRGLTGQITADLEVTGSAQAPAVQGRVQVHSGGFRNYRYESLVAEFRYTATSVAFNSTLQQTPTETLQARGTIPVSIFRSAADANDAMEVRITSTGIDLGVVQGLTTTVANVSGRLALDVKATGTSNDPHFEGIVSITGGAFGIPAAGVGYKGLETDIALGPDLITIPRFRILDEHNAPLTVSGQLTFHERHLGAIDIRLTSDNFEILDNEFGDVDIDSQLQIAGEFRRPIVFGSIKIEVGRLELDRVLTLFYRPYATQSISDVISAERTTAAAGSAVGATKTALQAAGRSGKTDARQPSVKGVAARGLFENLELQLQISIPDNLVLRGRQLRPAGPTRASFGDINVTVGGDLSVRKDRGAAVRLDGAVNTVRGTYLFQGRRFDIQRDGTIRFTGLPDFDPLLDITATRVIPSSRVEARVRITGTVKTPELSLTSSPPLDESDILSLILFNRPVNELATGERTALAATAGGLAAGFLAQPLGESVGRALNLDVVEITTSEANGQLIGGVTVGKQIGDRTFLRLQQEFGERNVTEFMLEFQLARYLRLNLAGAPETSGAANRIGQRRIERAGIDLIFFFSY